MRSSFAVYAVLFALSARAFAPGEIPINIAVRSDGNGEVYPFSDIDRAKLLYHIKRQSTAAPPESDTYPVTNDGSGPRPFAGTSLVGRGTRRQVTGDTSAPPEADVYPVKNDGTGVVAFEG